MKRLASVFYLALIAAAMLAVTTVEAQSEPAGGPTDEKYLELLRRQVATDKTEIMTEAVKMTDAQASAFWPIYREYQTEQAAIGDKRLALVKQYAESYGSLTNEKAAVLAKEWFSLQRARIDLLQKYHGRVEKVTSSLVAGRFAQVENVLTMLIDIQLAAEIPLLE